jgi:hypothetical protein
MTSKKAPSGKRAALPRASDRTKAFVKHWTRLSHSGRYDMKRLKETMLLLVARDEPLGPAWLDHPLVGEWGGSSRMPYWRRFLVDLSPEWHQRWRASHLCSRWYAFGSV